LSAFVEEAKRTVKNVRREVRSGGSSRKTEKKKRGVQRYFVAQ